MLAGPQPRATSVAREREDGPYLEREGAKGHGALLDHSGEHA
jgi:hypothetical protein